MRNPHSYSGTTVLVALFCFALAPFAAAQPVVYVGLNAVSGLGELHVVNSDGTGDRVLPLPVVEAGFPSMSKDGRFLTFTAQTPGRPNQSSRNVFLLNMLTGQTSQITTFEDQVTQDNFAFSLPWYHSLSPDSSTVAVWSFVRSLNGTVPVLQTFRVSDGFLLNSLFFNRVLTGFTQGGNGVDWHPTQNILVSALDKDIPVFDYNNPNTQLGFVAEGTILYLGSADQPPSQQLTFPRSYYYSVLGRIVWSGEADYSPTFSPNGQQVAYVRATYIQDSAALGYRQPSILALRIVNTNGTGDHQVLAFNQGVYVTHLSWSRDGTQLVFDAGNQFITNSAPYNAVDPTTDSLSIVNADGNNPHLLRAAPSGFPVWSPAGTTFCNLPGVVHPGGTPGTIDDCGPPITLKAVRTPAGQLRLDISGGMPNLLYRILGGPDPTGGTLQSLGTMPRAGATTSFTDTAGSNLPRRFYKVVLGDN